MSAHASILISVPSEAALAGSTGNSFDVTLTNTGPATVAIAGFRFQLLTTNTDITFTGGSFSTVAPYIFAGVSFDQDFSFTLDTLSSGQELDASDVSDVLSANVGAGSTVALGSVLFDMSANAAPGPAPLTLLAYPHTSLADSAGNNVEFIGSDGTITITPASSLPEPASAWLIAGGLALFGGRLRTRRG